MSQKSNTEEDILKNKITNLENIINEKNNVIKRFQTIKKQNSNGIEMVDTYTQTNIDSQSSNYKKEIDKELNEKNNIKQNNKIAELIYEIYELNKKNDLKIDELYKNSRDKLKYQKTLLTDTFNLIIEEQKIQINNLIYNSSSDIKQMRTEIDRSVKKGKEAWEIFKFYSPEMYDQYLLNTYPSEYIH